MAGESALAAAHRNCGGGARICRLPCVTCFEKKCIWRERRTRRASHKMPSVTNSTLNTARTRKPTEGVLARSSLRCTRWVSVVGTLGSTTILIDILILLTRICTGSHGKRPIWDDYRGLTNHRSRSPPSLATTHQGICKRRCRPRYSGQGRVQRRPQSPLPVTRRQLCSSCRNRS